ncbi:hypothetical protein ACP70R_019770 [Stipagrostis hirtigluma subsp. patula]
MRTKHPLHEAIGAGRWDAEAPLGRLVLVAHAAFLYAGFVPCGKPASRRLPAQVGAAASTITLRYTIPELVVRPRKPSGAGADSAVLRLCAHGRFLILYGYLAGDGNRPPTRWACVDAAFVAPVLSGDLDATAHALANDALGARLWKALAGGLCRHLYEDICGKNWSRLPPRLTSLPADLQAAILSRLGAKDLAMVECTCTELRNLVAGRHLWRAKYVFKLWWSLWPYPSERSGIDNSSRSWMEMFLTARRRWPSPSRRLIYEMYGGEMELWPLHHRRGWRRRLRPLLWPIDDLFDWDENWDDLDDRRGRHDPTERLIRRFQQRRSKVPVGDGNGRRRMAAAYGSSERRRCSEGVIHSPSARYRWTHR